MEVNCTSFGMFRKNDSEFVMRAYRVGDGIIKSDILLT